jgi:hypothetical protein
VTLLVSLGMMASLGAVVYLVSSSLPFLANSASADQHFGALNGCVARALSGPVGGFALSADGRALAAWSGQALVRCESADDGGSAATVVPSASVAAAAFDFDGELWLAQPELSSSSGGHFDIKPQLLTGTRQGVVAVERDTVYSTRKSGEVAGLYKLPEPVREPMWLSASADGERVALMAFGGLYVWRSDKLELLRAEAPCAVEGAWWAPEGHSMVLQCGPNGDYALQWDVDTATQSVLPRRERARSALVPKLGVYVQTCEQLACTAAAP